MASRLVSQPVSLDRHLAIETAGGRIDEAVAAVILALAAAATAIAALLGKGPLAGALGAATGEANRDGDAQKALDVMADEIIAGALRKAHVGWYISEEQANAVALDPAGSLLVAVDPLDGSSNIDVNVSVGTIFSIFPSDAGSSAPALLRPGSQQLAAGYFIYGPQTGLVVTSGNGVDLFVLDRDSGAFRLAKSGLAIPRQSAEFAVNASNYRHWHQPVRNYIDDCIAGTDGPIRRDHNMRWVASLIADAHRILWRGGVYLYPGDRRAGYAHGRLRLIYEASPIAMLVEQAGGMATDGIERILDKIPTSAHQRTPLVFGSSEDVARVATYHASPGHLRQSSPLFSNRGLFRG
jgi:fructose-1,6-bisphosphatase I